MLSGSEALCFDSKEVSILDSACLGHGEAVAGIKALPACSCSSESILNLKYSLCCTRSSCREFCTCSDQIHYVNNYILLKYQLKLKIKVEEEKKKKRKKISKTCILIIGLHHYYIDRRNNKLVNQPKLGMNTSVVHLELFMELLLNFNLQAQSLCN